MPKEYKVITSPWELTLNQAAAEGYVLVQVIQGDDKNSPKLVMEREAMKLPG